MARVDHDEHRVDGGVDGVSHQPRLEHAQHLLLAQATQQAQVRRAVSARHLLAILASLPRRSPFPSPVWLPSSKGLASRPLLGRPAPLGALLRAVVVARSVLPCGASAADVAGVLGISSTSAGRQRAQTARHQACASPRHQAWPCGRIWAPRCRCRALLHIWHPKIWRTQPSLSCYPTFPQLIFRLQRGGGIQLVYGSKI